MKKSFSKKLMILAFAFGGLFMIGNNVFANEDDSECPDDGAGGSYLEVTCYGRGTATWGRYYYCDGGSTCILIIGAEPDVHTGALKCMYKIS